MKNAVLFVFFLLTSALVFAQQQGKPHVGILSAVNATGKSSFDAGSKAVRDTVETILVQSGLYEVATSETTSPLDSDTEKLSVLAEKNGWDFIVFSRLEKASDEERAVYHLSVYNRAKKKVSLTRTSEPAELLDLFDAADATTAAVLGTMTGVHIGFGSISLKNSGEKGSYSIVLDDREVKASELSRVLNGEHTLVIFQDRLLGRQELVKEKIRVEENKKREVIFSVPFITVQELAPILAAEESVNRLWNDRSHVNDMDQALDKYEALFKDTSFSPRLSLFLSKIKEYREQWPRQKETLLAQAAESPILLFPVDGVTLGKTTESELSKMGPRAKNIDDDTKQPYHYYIVNGTNVWYDEKHLAERCYFVSGLYNLPSKWQDLGMDWKKSYNDWLALAKRYGWEAKIVESPQTKKWDNHDSFNATVEFKFQEKSINYLLRLDFGYSKGTTASDEATLYSITLKYIP